MASSIAVTHAYPKQEFILTKYTPYLVPIVPIVISFEKTEGVLTAPHSILCLTTTFIERWARDCVLLLQVDQINSTEHDTHWVSLTG